MKYSGLLIVLLVGLVIAGNPVLLIVPGERVGPVSIFMSREELSEAVGDEFLVDTPDMLEAWESVLGDEWFSSRDPGMIRLNPHITSIFIYRSFE